MQLEFTLNGAQVSADIPDQWSLLYMLREHFGLTGAKPGCEVGECGACSVILDGRLVNACLVLAPEVHGATVLTIEGLHGPDGGPNDLQLNFVDYGAVQCGYCTPGMVMAAEALLARNPDPTRAEIRAALAGNLCRCTGYIQIIQAIEATARTRRGAQP